MDIIQFLQLLFCCWLPKTKKRDKAAKRFPKFHHLSRTFRNRLNTRQGKDGHQYVLFVRTRANYHDLRSNILRGIGFDSRSTLYIMCPGNQVPNDYVSTLLNQYGEVIHLLDKWITRDGMTAWAGAVVMYESIDDAKFAVKDLPMRCRYIRAVPLKDVLSVMVDFELLHTWSSHYSCTVLISARKAPPTSYTTSLIYDLSDYGEVEKLLINNRVFSMNVVCEATYPFLTQAYLAMMMTGGRFYGNLPVSARLAEDPRNDSILEGVKLYMLEGMSP